MNTEDRFDDPYVSDLDLRMAWARHDREMLELGIDPKTGWSGSLKTKGFVNNIMGKRLTDAKIAKYEREGFYSQEYREARKKMAEKKHQKRVVRQGNFDVGENGRMIYRPL